ncbi:hypothetical protein ACWDYH_20225 [Nocardia goodfellowii]
MNTTATVQKTGHRHPRTPRQTHAVCGLVQQRAMQVDVLAEFLGTGRNHVYELVSELRAGGLVHPLERVGSGPKWVVPTRRAISWYFGQSRPDWQPSPLWSARGRDIARARIALGATAVQAWESERELSYRTHHPTRYPYDGRLVRTDSAPAAVMVIARTEFGPADLARLVSRAGQRADTDGCTALLLVHSNADSTTVVRTAAEKASLPPTLAVGATTLDALTRDGRASIERARAGQRLGLVA